MAKKRTPPKKRSSKSRKAVQPQHSLPSGFWAQVGAIVLIIVSLLMVVGWFGAGGPVVEWIDTALSTVMGYTKYALPILLLYLAIETFREEANKLAFVVKFAAVLWLLWWAGLFGLMSQSNGQPAGGFIGDVMNKMMLSMVDGTVAIAIYAVLLIITTLFVVSLTPSDALQKIRQLLSSTSKDDEQNVKIMKKAAAEPAKTDTVPELKLNAGVPTLTPEEKEATSKKSRRGSSMKNSSQPDKSAEEQTALVSINDPNWQPPGVELLGENQNKANPGDVNQNAQSIKETLGEFNIDVQMEGANIGPRVTQYTLRPPAGIKLNRITALETNIALNLAAQSLRIEAPIPGKRAVGIEVPNVKSADVRLRSILSSGTWKSNRQPLSFAIGQDIAGDVVVGELNKMPHLLIAGQTGSGKSVMINTLLTSLLYRNSPSEMKLILVDPKQVEMAPYEDIPHLLTPVITEPEKTVSALKWAVNEMERRYKLLAEERIRDITSYNKKIQAAGKKVAVKDEDGNTQQHENGAMPYIVIVIDELADLMMVAARDVEALIVRLAQKARAVGIHLVLATQRPSVDVITGLIKANVPARIAFTVASNVDSRTIIDKVGAEKLLGQGDMLMSTPSMPKPKRIQGSLVTDDEVVKITDYLRLQSAPQYNDEIVAQPVQLNGKGGVVMDSQADLNDPVYKKALELVITSGKASSSLLQRRLGIGYAKAARYIDQMEDQGIVGPASGSSKPRDVLVASMDELDESQDDDLG